MEVNSVEMKDEIKSVVLDEEEHYSFEVALPSSLYIARTLITLHIPHYWR